MTARLAMSMAAAFVAAAAGIASAQQPAAAPPPFAPPNLTEKGVRALAASCAICHGTDGHAASGSTVAGLAGRPSQEIVLILGQFKDGTRPATVMHQIAKGYSPAEIEAMATYFSKQSR